MTAIASGVEAPAIATAPTAPTIEVHITGVTLGTARWDAYAHGATVVDLVPTYRFHVNADGGTSNDIEVLALGPSAITFTNPIPTPEPPGTASNAAVAISGSPPPAPRTRTAG